MGLRISGHRAAEYLLNLRKSTKVLGSIRRVRFTKATQRHANIRENKGSSLGVILVEVPHERSPYTVKIEDRSQEDDEIYALFQKIWNELER